MPATTERTLIIEYANGDKERVTIPGNAKVTYSSINPQSKGGYVSDYALRVYEGRTASSSQIACFVGVKSFCDASLKRKRLQVDEAHEHESSSNGRESKSKSKTRREERWEDVDVPF